MIETIDLDNCNWGRLLEIIEKIRRRGCVVLDVRESSSLNGFHLIIDCNCGGCRLVFDDPERFSKDLRRPSFARNVLFQVRRRKLYLNTGCGLGAKKLYPIRGGLAHAEKVE